MQIIFLGLVVLAVLSVVGMSEAFAQESTTLDNIVINEVDINPPGDDSASINEWVELYNPTDSEINLGGWEIASTTVLKKTMTIIAGTTIQPGEFLTYSYQSVWFTDSNESVELRDENGIVIDKTPLLSDLANDFTSWQRIYDGYDLDSSSDWKFVTSTTGSSNGKLPESSQQELIVSIEDGLDIAGVGKTITIKVTGAKQTVTLEIISSTGEIIETLSFVASDQGDINLPWIIPKDVESGTYTISAKDAYNSDSAIFVVEVPEIQEKLDEIKRIADKSEPAITVSTDKSSYLVGEKIMITGKTISDLTDVTFRVTSPSGNNVVAIGQVSPNYDGEFVIEIKIEPIWTEDGFYTIAVMQSVIQNSLYPLEILVKVTNVTSERNYETKPTISVATDKSSYSEGETIVISGQVSTLLGSTPIRLQLFTEGNLVEIAQITVARDRTYSHTVLVEGPLWEESGEYLVNVSYGVGNIAETEFSYVSELKTTTSIFDVRLDRQGTFDVEYTITGGTLFNIIPDGDFLSLIFSIDTYNNGILVVELPRDLIDSKFNNKDDSFTILVDGDEPNFTEIQTNSQIRTIRIELPAGSEEIEIIGSTLGNDEKSISQEPSIVVTTDKSSYSDGEAILIYGNVRDLYSGTPVSVIVTAPRDYDGDGEDDLVSIAQAKVGADNTFTSELTAGGALMKTDGIYTVIVQYGTANRSDTTTFYFEGTFAESIVEEILDEITPISNDISESTIPSSLTMPSNDNKTIKDLKETIRDLKLENHTLKQKITSLQSEIDELKDLLINGLKEIYNWKSNNL